MSILHTVNKPGQPLALCLRAASRGDSVLLIEEAVYELMGRGLDALPDDCAVFVMGADALARAELIDYERFVALCVEHDQVLSWF